MKTKIILFLLIICFYGCKSSSSEAIAFLIDISGSTMNLRDKYFDEMIKIINQSFKSENSSLSVIFGKTNDVPIILFFTISDNPYYQDNIQTFRFEGHKFNLETIFTFNYEKFNDTLIKLRNAVIETGKKIIYNSKPSPKTDIYTPLYLLSNELSNINAKKKRIYIFSDLIDNQGKNKKICNLRGIEVYVLLAFDRKLNIRQKQIDQIKKEFLDYLNQCNATVSLSSFKISF